jgi:hypothetical protein
MLGYQRTPMMDATDRCNISKVISLYPVLRLTTPILQEKVCPPSYLRAPILGRETSGKIKAGTRKVA